MNGSRYGVGVVSVGLGALLVACTLSPSSSPSPSEPVSILATQQASANLAQSLPITAQAVLGGKTIQLEVAKTPQQQAIGLMYRPKLADDRGMLFPFQPPRPVQFWMKNVLINLDMVFLRQGVVKAIAANVPPCKTEPCAVYGPATTEIDQVIELRGGRAAELGVKVGDRVSITFLPVPKSQP